MSGVADLLMALMGARAYAGIVTLSGETVAGTATALLNINSDGTATKQQDVSTTQIDSGTDWIIPNAASSQAGFTVRFHKDSGDDPTTGTLDSDLSLGSNRTVGFNSDAGKSCSLTVTIKHNGVTIDTGTYDLSTT